MKILMKDIHKETKKLYPEIAEYEKEIKKLIKEFISKGVA